MIIKIITKNLWVKIFCFVLTTVLWIYVASTQNTISKFPGTIKIKAINTPANLVPVFDVKDIEIKVMAKPTVWQKLSSESFTANINLNNFVAGTHEASINVNALVFGASVVEVKPNKILVTLEPLVSKEIPVTKKIIGNAAEGFVSGTVAFSPDRVKVRGAKSLLESTNEATATIELNNETSDFVRDILLTSLDDQGNSIKDVELLPSEVSALVSIVKGSDVKSVGIKPKIIGSPTGNKIISSISVNPSVVDITGSRNLINDIKYLETSTIDLTNMTQNYNRDVQINIPAGVSLLASQTDKVRVVIIFAESEVTQEITVNKINTQNIGSVNVIEFLPKEIKISVSGSPADLTNLNSNQISLNLDFSSKKANSNNDIVFDLSTANFTYPATLTIVNISPTSITAKTR